MAGFPFRVPPDGRSELLLLVLTLILLALAALEVTP
jgi:hypothetical protein